MNHIGIDIAATGVRVVELEKKLDSSGFVTIKKAAIEPFGSTSPLSEGEITDPVTVAEAIRTALTKAGISRKSAVVGVSTNATARLLVIPAGARDHERETLLRSRPMSLWDLLDAKTARLSWRVVDTYRDEEGSPREVLAVAAVATETIQVIEHTLDLAQVRPAAIDLTASALIRALVRSAPGEDVVQTIVDVGAQHTVVVTRNGAYPRDVTTVNYGGDHITDAIQRTMGFASREQAEDHKRHLALPSLDDYTPTFGSLANQGDQPLSEVERMVTQAADDMVSAIADVIDQDTSNHATEPTRGVLLVGGGARLRGIRERLAARVGRPVHLGQPWVSDRMGRQARFLEGDRRAITDLTVAVGLAMWGSVSQPSTDLQ